MSLLFLMARAIRATRSANSAETRDTARRFELLDPPDGGNVVPIADGELDLTEAPDLRPGQKACSDLLTSAGSQGSL